MAPGVCRQTHEDPFFEVTSRKCLRDLCGRKFVGKSRTKSFSGKFGEIRAKNSLHPQMLACSYTYVFGKYSRMTEGGTSRLTKVILREQGQIKGGATGAISPGPPLQGDPP